MPGEAFLDGFARALTDNVPGIPCRAGIDSRAASAGEILCHMRRDVERTRLLGYSRVMPLRSSGRRR